MGRFSAADVLGVVAHHLVEGGGELLGVIRGDAAAQLCFVDDAAGVPLREEQNGAADTEGLIYFSGDTVLHAGIFQRYKAQFGIREQRKDFLMLKHSAKMHIVQPARLRLLLARLSLRALAEDQKLNLFML